MSAKGNKQVGFTIIELMISLTIAALLLSALNGLVNNAFATRDDTATSIDSARDARFAMQRMVTAVLGTQRLMLPLADNPNTNWREHVREQTLPASAPEGSSTLATAVLAVTLDPSLDINEDGVFDADNDGDGLFDEDPPGDVTNDFETGIVGIDDDGDGQIDEAHSSSSPAEDDDDEDGTANEDGWNGIDDDGDGVVDEDPKKDMNGDALPGIGGFDDDGDGTIDEGDKNDDDEDGLINEDWLDAVVFFLDSGVLMERRPNLNPADGADFSKYAIAENVTRFRVERIPAIGKRSVLVDITLELTPPGGDPVSLNTRIRVGGGS